MDRYRDRPRAWQAVGLVAVLTAALAAVYGLFVLTPLGQRLDALGFGAVVSEAPNGLAKTIRRDYIVALAVLVAGLGVAALVERRWRNVAAAVLVVVGSSGCSVLLREHLFRPDLGDHVYLHNTFPSGHTTAVAGLCVAWLLLWPGRVGPGHAVVAGALSVVAAAASVASYDHRPSDVVGSLLLVAAITVAACGSLRPVVRRAAGPAAPTAPVPPVPPAVRRH